MFCLENADKNVKITRSEALSVLTFNFGLTKQLKNIYSTTLSLSCAERNSNFTRQRKAVYEFRSLAFPSFLMPF